VILQVHQLKSGHVSDRLALKLFEEMGQPIGSRDFDNSLRQFSTKNKLWSMLRLQFIQLMSFKLGRIGFLVSEYTMFPSLQVITNFRTISLSVRSENKGMLVQIMSIGNKYNIGIQWNLDEVGWI